MHLSIYHIDITTNNNNNICLYMVLYKTKFQSDESAVHSNDPSSLLYKHVAKCIINTRMP